MTWAARTRGGPATSRPSAGRGALAGLAVLLAACGGGEGRPEGEDRATAVVEARTRGQAALQEDRLGEAARHFRRLTELAPEESAGPANLALVALRRGDPETAERRARQAIDRNPDDPWAHLILAKALELRGRERAARDERRRALELDPGSLRALWALAGGSRERPDSVPPRTRRTELLGRIVERAPSNVAARLELTAARLAAGRAEEAAEQLEEIRSLVPEFPDGASRAFDRALDRARAGDAAGAREPAARFHELMRMTSRYQADLEALRGPRGEATGFPSLSFSHELSLDVPDEEAVLEALRFADATRAAGLGRPGREEGGRAGGEADRPGAPVVALGDVDADGDRDLYVFRPAGDAGAGTSRLLRNDLGKFVDATPAPLRALTSVRAAAFADYDADGRPDLYVVRDGPNRLFRNEGEGALRDVTAEAGVEGSGAAGAFAFADVDHDGDLDLVLGSAGETKLYRNDGDGGFTDVPGAMGLDRGRGPVRDVAFADFDDDADLDLLTARGPAGIQLFANLRQGRFRPVGDSLGLANAPPADGVAVGDYDNDGRPDVLVTGRADGPVLYRNRAGRFTTDRRAAAGLPGPEIAGTDGAFLDFDNDGRLDLVLSLRAAEPGLALLHNEGDAGFADLSGRLPAGVPGTAGLAVFDYNRDGDRDVLAATAGGLRLLRNDGGNVNHHFDLRLVARGPGSGKVNRFGVGSKVEVRAGDLYQSRTVRGPVTHFGLGHRLKADVVRIVWTNGVPQYLYYPGTDQDLVQDQQLKGSCAFVYAWDGDGYAFVTDAMWRSALGMPVGIMGGERDPSGSGSTPSFSAGPSRRRAEAGRSGRAAAAAGPARRYASAGASREYVRIAPGRLEPEDGRYRLQLTEELWEVAYVDQMRLLAVDHPDSVAVLVDEALAPPAPPRLRLYTVADPLPPASARDGDGDDLLPALRERDEIRVDDLEPGPYQGIVERHQVTLELPRRVARSEHAHLFLQGWIFPTDASINVAVAQSDSVEVRPPRLELPDGRGGWRTADVHVGFPSGKAKTVAVDLGGIVPVEDPRIRVRTNMQIYWNRAFFAAGPSVAGPLVEGGAERAAERLRAIRTASGSRSPTPRIHALRPAAAHLHHRGFSREYRRGGRHGPHWFDYQDVSTRSPWLPIPGRYTRYGDVVPLLDEPDDRYVVMAPGDELTVEFAADAVPGPREGRTRTFLLYTDGWIKDADLNTAGGRTVAPLPFHGQSRYPPGPNEAYPRDSVHRAYLDRYQTREIDGSTLRLAPSP